MAARSHARAARTDRSAHRPRVLAGGGGLWRVVPASLSVLKVFAPRWLCNPIICPSVTLFIKNRQDKKKDRTIMILKGPGCHKERVDLIGTAQLCTRTRRLTALARRPRGTAKKRQPASGFHRSESEEGRRERKRTITIIARSPRYIGSAHCAHFHSQS